MEGAVGRELAATTSLSFTCAARDYARLASPRRRTSYAGSSDR
jgi:hypothetical protein